MIIFEVSSGRFRDSETGRIRSDVAGLASSLARRQILKNKKRKPTLEFLKTYRKGQNKKKKKVVKTRADFKRAAKKFKKPRRKKVFEETDFSNYDGYIEDWKEEMGFILDEEDVDLDTP